MAGWNLELPSYTELLLWRISSAIQLGTIILTWLSMPLQNRTVSDKTQKMKSWSSSAVRSVPSFRTNSSNIPKTGHQQNNKYSHRHHSYELNNSPTSATTGGAGERTPRTP